MYHTPVLERYGTLRELTADPSDNAKRPDVNDLATVFAEDENDGCNPNAQPGASAACVS